VSARTDNRRRTRLGAITADPYRKLASIALAIGLYYFLDKQITKPLDVTLGLRAVGSAAAAAADVANRQDLLVITSDNVTNLGFVDAADEHPLQHVVIHLVGPKFIVQGFERNQPHFVAGPFQKVDWNRVSSVEFTAADLRPVDQPQDVAKNMDPPQVRIVVEQNNSTDVAVKLDSCELELPRGDEQSIRDRMRPDTARFSRPVVRISGPASSLDRFQRQGGKPLVLTLSIVSGRSLSGKLRLNSDDKLLRADEMPTLVALDLLPSHKEFNVELLIKVDDLSLPEAMQGKYQPREHSKLVTIKAAGELQSQLAGYEDAQEAAAWARQYLRLTVWIERPTDAASYTPTLALAARLEVLGPLAIRLDPSMYGLTDTVTITLERRP
jgi:hypothetical protein